MHIQSLKLICPIILEELHLQDNNLFDLGVKAIRNVSKYPLYLVNHAPAKSEEIHLQENTLFDPRPRSQDHTKRCQSISQVCCFLRNTTTSSLSGIELKSPWPWVSKSGQKCCRVVSSFAAEVRRLCCRVVISLKLSCSRSFEHQVEYDNNLSHHSSIRRRTPFLCCFAFSGANLVINTKILMRIQRQYSQTTQCSNKYSIVPICFYYSVNQMWAWLKKFLGRSVSYKNEHEVFHI